MKADDLRKNYEQTIFVNNFVKDLRDVVDDEIKKSHSYCRREVKVNLPIVITIPGMSNENACICVYGELIKWLKKDNYRVTIDLNGERSILHIKWKSDDIIKENAKILSKHVKKNITLS